MLSTMRVKKRRVACLMVFIGLLLPFLCIQLRNSQIGNALNSSTVLWDENSILKLESNIKKMKDDKTVDLRRVLFKKTKKKTNIYTTASGKAENTVISESLKNKKKYGAITSDSKENGFIKTEHLISNDTKDFLNLNGVKRDIVPDEQILQLGNNFENLKGSKENIEINVSKSREESKFLSAWQIWSSMVKSRSVTPIGKVDTNLTAILKAMERASIISADVGYGGTALKVSLLLDGEQEVVFRPKRYLIDKIIEGTPIQGHDRHNGEIAAFHIDRILGFHRAPPVVGRKINLVQEIKSVGELRLLHTFFKKGNNTCFFGVCHLCRREMAACASGNTMEGSLTLWLPFDWPLKKWRCPWQRTTRTGLKSLWEVENYCPVISKLPRTFLLDIIDTAVFDFLIGNADRHHYEWYAGGSEDEAGMILHLDNAKSFGDPNHDILQVLVPLFQCCLIRHSTLWRLVKIHDSGKETLGDLVRTSLKSDPLYPVLADGHFDALNRRLGIVVNMTESCIGKNGRQNVIIDDGK